MQTFEKGRKRENCIKHLRKIIANLDKVLEDNKVPEFRKEWTRDLISVIGLAISFVPEKAKKYCVIDDLQGFKALERSYLKTEECFTVDNDSVKILRGYQRISSYPKIYDALIMVDITLDNDIDVFQILSEALKA